MQEYKLNKNLLTIHTLDVYTYHMNSSHSATIHKRINITLPEETIQLLDRVAEKGDRSGLIDRAVRFYVQEIGKARLRKLLRLGATARASRDLAVAAEWFSIESEI